MAQPPCSPWRVAEEREAASGRTPTATDLIYDGTALGLDVTLYRVLAPHGYHPAQIDEWEAWQAAEVIEGLLDHAHMAQPRKGNRKPRPRTTRVTGPAPVRSGRDLLAQRVAHAKGEGPKPEPRAAGRDLAGLISVLSEHEGADN